MSKILKALEKAKRDVVTERTAPVVEPPVVPAPREPGRRPGKSLRHRKRPSHVLATRTIDPGVLRGVDPHVETLHKPMSVVSEQYRAMRNRIERLNFDGRIQSIVVTSATKGEGKTVTATNLAVVLAQDATKNVLLVDADLRRPKVHKVLSVDMTPGLGDLLLGRATAAAVVQATPYFGLSVVAVGTVEGHPSELLASPEFEDFIAAMRAEYDYIVLDTPPLHPISDVNFLADTVDGVVLVVRAGKTHRGLLKQATESLPAEKLLGTVLNRTESLRSGYGYGYGSGYYYKYY